MERYHHRQSGKGMWLAMGLTAAAIVLVTAALSASVPAQERGGVAWLLFFIAAVLGFFAWLFGGLTVSLDGSHIWIRFGPGWPRKSIALAEVRGAEVVRNSWWYGWGIRLTPHGWLWNVSGLDAVELELASGRRTRIGTDEPRELAAAINRAIGA